MAQVIIIGAGINGITTALTLQLLGYSTKIYAESLPDQLNTQGNPAFASLYPSASIIPHSVHSDDLETLFKDSQSFFYDLKERSFPGLSIHNHYEIFEFEEIQPKYLPWMHNFELIKEHQNNFPRRADVENLYGWRFDCIFADWPIYFPTLIELYRENGGEIVTKKVGPEDVSELPASAIINCSGLGSNFLFENQEEPLLLRGHLVHVKSDHPASNLNGKAVSYNYTPGASVYSDSAGDACDVYCYPRKDGWILGGSRQAGTITKAGEWKGTETESSLCEINDIYLPSQIVDLNRQVMEHTFGITFGNIENFSSTVGYRYIRSESNGLRLDSEILNDNKIYHNYGHGGAGVTLSWGCALRIASQLSGNYNADELTHKLLDSL